MDHRLALVPAALGIALLLGARDGRAAGAPDRACPPPPHAREVRSSRVAIVYRDADDPDGLTVCLRRTGREVQLLGGESITDHARIAGRFLVVRDHYDSGAPDPCYGFSVQTYDLTVRSEAVDFPIDPLFEQARGSCDGSFSEPVLPTSLVVKVNGAVAWIWCVPRSFPSFDRSNRCAPDRPRFVVRRDARGGSLVTLDRGVSIAAASLRLRGGTLTWRKGRSVRSGRLR